MEQSEGLKIEKTKIGRTFLVLMDFSDASYAALKYSISLAKLMKAHIHVLHIADVGSIVESDNQAAAMREVEAESKRIEKKLKSIVEIVSAEEVKCSHQYLMGNITSELELFTKEVNPDLIIVGKKASKLNFSGRLSNYLMNRCKHSVLIVDEDSEFRSDMNIAIGYNGNGLNNYDPSLLFELDKYTKNPLTCVLVNKEDDENENFEIPDSWKSLNGKTNEVQYIKRNDNNMVDGLVEYISNNNVEFLCIGRDRQKGLLKNLFFKQSSDTSKIINRAHIPVLLMQYISESNKKSVPA